MRLETLETYAQVEERAVKPVKKATTGIKEGVKGGTIHVEVKKSVNYRE